MVFVWNLKLFSLSSDVQVGSCLNTSLLMKVEANIPAESSALFAVLLVNHLFDQPVNLKTWGHILENS